MEDQDIIARISQLAEQEQQLEEAHVGEGLSEEDHAQLHSIEATLDRLWDLLRQRRALRDAGRPPEEATERSEATVEEYLQ